MNIKQRTATIKLFGMDDDGSNKPAIFSFTFPETYLEFRIVDIEQESPNSCYVKIYGISESTYRLFEEKKFQQFKKTQKCDIYLGYDRDEELVWSGVVSRVRYEFSFGKQYMEILLTQGIQKFNIQRHSICIQKQTNIYDALQTLCNTFGYTHECLNENAFKSISIKPTTLEGNMKKCLDDLLNKDMHYYIDNETLITYTFDGYIKKDYKLLFNNGLVAYPSLDTGKLDEGDFYTIMHKVIPSIRKGAKVKIPITQEGRYSSIDTGTYAEFEVLEYVTSFSTNQDSTEMKCRRL